MKLACETCPTAPKRDIMEVAFAIRPEITIKPTEQLVTVDTLRVGDFVKVQVIHLAGAPPAYHDA